MSASTRRVRPAEHAPAQPAEHAPAPPAEHAPAPPAEPATSTAESTVIGPEALKGLTHPLRLRLLAELDHRGRATATQLAEALDQSSGATSYHLRQLFRHGLIEEDDTPAPGRERYWRPLRGGWAFPAFELAQEPGAAPAVEMVLQEMLADDRRERERVWAMAPSWPTRWRDRVQRRQSHLTLSSEQTRSLQDELYAVLDRYRALSPGEDARRIVVDVDILPTEFGPDGSVLRGAGADPAAGLLGAGTDLPGAGADSAAGLLGAGTDLPGAAGVTPGKPS